ncbi:transposase [Maribacter sp. ACAM166]|nr:transposase [Maribacter sp. ACAM166]
MRHPKKGNSHLLLGRLEKYRFVKHHKFKFPASEDVQEKFDIWREDYNSFRPHSSLGDMFPNEYIKMNKNSLDSLVITGT